MPRLLPLLLLLAAMIAACGDDGSPTNDNANQNNGNGNTTEFEAVPHERCPQADLVGVVAVYSQGGPLEASASVNDGPEVLGNEAALSDAACTFYEALAPGFCDPACQGDQLCDAAGACQPIPQPVAGLELTLHAGQDTQILLPEFAGSIWGAVTLPGRAFAATLSWGAYTVRLAETVVPDPLPDLVGTMHGDSMSPTGLDFVWTPAAAAEVHTLIPVNHHAGGPTYTECAVPSAVGAFSVTEAMLAPLAVVTGLEFQGLEHVRVAAAVTPVGCIEFRWQVYQQPTW